MARQSRFWLRSPQGRIERLVASGEVTPGAPLDRLPRALHMRGDAFSDEEKARDFAYYEPLTVRDSSLSACTQAVIAAETGHLELAYDYFWRSRPDRPRQPRAQHTRRPPHRLTRRRLDRGRGRSRRYARPRRNTRISRRGFPSGSTGSPSAPAFAVAGSAPKSTTGKRAIRCVRGRRLRSPTTARRSRSAATSPRRGRSRRRRSASRHGSRLAEHRCDGDRQDEMSRAVGQR
jgi:alpha,alpha-trehalose phosphorylase